MLQKLIDSFQQNKIAAASKGFEVVKFENHNKWFIRRNGQKTHHGSFDSANEAWIYAIKHYL